MLAHAATEEQRVSLLGDSIVNSLMSSR